MRTIALRFGETFSPPCGTIDAHREVIKQLGYVWYGKKGNKVSDKVIQDLLQNTNLRILLIASGKSEKYWAYVSEISTELPELEAIPSYYRNSGAEFKTWFKITRFEKANKDVLNNCIVVSSHTKLNISSRWSMCPCFIIDYFE